MAERGIRSEEEGGGSATPFLLRKPLSRWVDLSSVSRALQGEGREGVGSNSVLRR
jgi:hypothetical protein